MTRNEEHNTPWRRVFAKFRDQHGMNQSGFAAALNRHRSKISRVLGSEKGLINGNDQERLIEVAKALNVDLTDADLTPGQK